MPILRKKSSRKTNTETGNDNLIGVKQTGAKEEEEKHSLNGMDKKDAIEPLDVDKTKKNAKGALTNPGRNRKTKSSETIMEEEGIDYPLDIWFIISEYINPEAVGKFAQICRSSYHVTTTGKFWFHLYKTYYGFVPGLPERLQPQCMVRTYGLRACVIRTLHHTYFALKREPDDIYYLKHDEPHSLVKRRCCLMWHKKGKMRWYFYFKLKEIPKSTKKPLAEKSKINGKKTDFLEMLEDVAVNSEEGCKVLRVTCLKYSMLPPVIGLILQSVSMTLMPGFKDHRLQLGFGTSDIPNTLTNQVILNDVVRCQILDWWHPLYPHQDAITTIELPQSDFWDQS
ncbi:transmembrane protein fates-shifted isoform X3 [Andrena cerasifolii]|uniref:transmembrane protein fates-shifted isoform X3 n=1 Tax=Andrena cerasifolii TaxID=2819439 RepID=UPI004037C3B3